MVTARTHPDDEAAARPRLLFVGTYHMANPGRDYANVQADDVLSERRQDDIRECVDRLKRFGPTKVALEAPAERADHLDDQYQQYRRGSFQLTANEVHQLGFRIAAESGHARVHAIDWEGGRSHLDRVIEFGRSHGQEGLIERIFGAAERQVEEINTQLKRTTIAEVLCALNDPEHIRREGELYLAMAGIGEGDDFAGAEWLAGWYERNLKIFARLVQITASSEERILVIFGSGHLPLLTGFARDSGGYEVETAHVYLCGSG